MRLIVQLFWLIAVALSFAGCWRESLFRPVLKPVLAPVVKLAGNTSTDNYKELHNRYRNANASLKKITFPPVVKTPKDAHLRKIWVETPRLPKIQVSTGLEVSIVSGIPIFGKAGSYIALLTEGGPDKLWGLFHASTWRNLSQQVFFCSGPKGSHRSPMTSRGSVLMCPWPSNQRRFNRFNVHVEHAGKALGSFVASHDPKFVKRYEVMACVRDLYEPTKQTKRNGVFKELIQWMEWSLLHGVGHILVYTFGPLDSLEEKLLKPYLAAGVATMVHFDDRPQHPRTRHGYLINDCLFRARNHAQWLMPVIDVDEYLYVRGGLKNALKHKVFGNLQGVHSLAFQRKRFAKAAINQLDISSTRYDENDSNGWRNPKQFVHVDSVYRVSTHQTEVFDIEKTAITVDPEIAVIHHYRKSYYNDGDKTANATDTKLLADVAPLTEAIRHRFGLQASQVPIFLEQLAQARVAPSGP
eukprot:Skav222296  [mRNA]  locus=scaffold3734:110667:112073:+ [translate_table: standard]